MPIKISWGTRIFLLYTGFVALIVTLVFSASRMDFDLVSKDYYQQEIGFQKRLDATSNSNGLSSPVAITANESRVMVLFPQEFKAESFEVSLRFYSPINDTHDREFTLPATDGKISIDRAKLDNTAYRLQLSWTVAGKDYYQEIPFNLQTP